MKNENLFLILLGAAIFLGLFYKGGEFFATTTIPYYEYRCVDVSEYKLQGYVTASWDTSCPNLKCEVVKKDVFGKGISTRGMRGAAYACDCYPGCISPKPDDGVCEKAGLVGYKLCGCDGYFGICCPVLTDYKGGCERVENTCTFLDDQAFVMESFIGPLNITKSSTRYEIVGFCNAKPAWFTYFNTSYSDTTVYQKLINDESIVLREYETLLLYYVTIVTPEISPCKYGEGQAWNANLKTCSPATPIITSCTAGVSVPGLGLCVVPGNVVECPAGSSKEILPNGSVYCVKYLPPVYKCPDGYSYYDYYLNGCVMLPDVNFKCSEGSYFAPNTSECAVLGGEWVACDGCPPGQQCLYCPVSYCNKGQVCLVNKVSVVKEVDGEMKTLEVCPDYARTPHQFTDKCVYSEAVKSYGCKDGYVLSGGKCVSYFVVNNTVNCPPGTEKRDNYCVVAVIKNLTTVNASIDASSSNSKVSNLPVYVSLIILVIVLLFFIIRKDKR